METVTYPPSAEARYSCRCINHSFLNFLRSRHTHHGPHSGQGWNCFDSTRAPAESQPAWYFQTAELNMKHAPVLPDCPRADPILAARSAVWA